MAANTPQSATDTALLAPEITLTSVLPQHGQYTFVSIGAPQPGQVLAVLDTSLPHSGHLTNAMVLPSTQVLISTIFHNIITYVA